MVENINLLNTGLSESTENLMLPYPNPTMGMLTIALPSNSTNAQILVINSLGKVVNMYKSTDGGITTQIDLSDLKSGLYFIQLKTNNTQHHWQIVKE